MPCSVFFYTRENKLRSSTFVYTKYTASATSEQSNERGQKPDSAGMFSRQIPAYAGLTSGQVPGVRPGGGMITVGIDSYIKYINFPNIFL